MTGLLVLLTVLSALVLLAGIFYRSLWWSLAGKFYRNPEAIAPSDAGFTLRSAVLVIIGIIMLIVCITQLTPNADATSSGDTQKQCRELEKEVGTPSSLDSAQREIRDATSEKDFEVKKTESSKKESLDVPKGGETMTIETTTWTVRDQGEEVTKFTWTESQERGLGRFSAQGCHDS